MHDPLVVGVVEGEGHLTRDAETVLEGELGFAAQPGTERFTLDVRDAVPELAGRAAGLEHRQHVWMLQASDKEASRRNPSGPRIAATSG